jgi:indole-3-glycerol phosphate synthase
VLAQLFEAAAEDAAERERSISRAELESAAQEVVLPPSAYDSLAKAEQIKLIAEIKRASPSRGEMAEIPDPADLGIGYQAAGAHAISVLTERSGFRGSLEDLEVVSKSVAIPTLRKDFISNEYQILEAKVAGASMVLLILAQLNSADFKRLFDFAHAIGLEVLVETHNEAEIEVAASQSAKLIGINTRDLKTFKTDIGLFETMASILPARAIRVAESSVRSISDVQRYRDAGADVVLVGEALVTGDYRSLIPQIISVS